MQTVSKFDQTYVDWMRREAEAGTPPAPAATVVLLRDAPAGGALEVLLLRRNAAVEFVGGMWVFPGGRVDPQDHDGAAGFLAWRTRADEVTIDGSEIHAHAWMTPAAALARQRAHEVQLAPPTWMTLHYLARSATADEALAAYAAREPRFYETRMMKDEHDIYFVWQGDAAYPDLPPDTPGPRHRVTVGASGWELDDSGMPF